MSYYSLISIMPKTAAFTGLLDTYSGASAAYSLRRLSSTYTGNLIRVRRSSDNAEQNIGYNSSNVLDTASLLTFVGAGNGFITTWYDQSGNANNATQTTAANQPQIVSSGAMITTNGKNSVRFDGTNDHFILGSTINVASSHFQSIAGKRNASSQLIYGLSGDTGTNYICAHSSDNFFALQGRSTFTQRSNSTDTTANQILLTGENNAGTMAIYKNSVVIPSTQISDSRTMTINTIAKYFFGFYVTGNLQEIVYYNSNQSTNRTGIETNINTFYTIY